MSDRRLVSFDSQQFTALTTALGDINATLAHVERTLFSKLGVQSDPSEKLDAIIARLNEVAGVPAELSLLREEVNIIHGLLAESGNAEVVQAINNLDRKVSEFMATQEERLRGVKTKLDTIQSGVDKIQQQLADLKANNPELEDEISAIEVTAAAIDTDVNPAAPDTGSGSAGTATEPAPAEGGGGGR